MSIRKSRDKIAEYRKQQQQRKRIPVQEYKYRRHNPDGTLGPWQQGPPPKSPNPSKAPVPSSGYSSAIRTPTPDPNLLKILELLRQLSQRISNIEDALGLARCAECTLPARQDDFLCEKHRNEIDSKTA